MGGEFITLKGEQVSEESIHEILTDLFSKDELGGQDDFYIACGNTLNALGKKKPALEVYKKSVRYWLERHDGYAIHYIWAAENARDHVSEKWAKSIEKKAVMIFAEDLASIGLQAFENEGFYLLRKLLKLADEHKMAKERNSIIKAGMDAYNAAIESGYDTDGKTKLSDDLIAGYKECIEEIKKMKAVE